MAGPTTPYSCKHGKGYACRECYATPKEIERAAHYAKHGVVRLCKDGTIHLYAIEVEGPYQRVEVEANNRDQATRRAERAGYVVRSVNMIG